MSHSRLPVQGVTSFLSQGSRPVQEDHLLFLQERGIFVVSDGFGGPAGVEASRLGCESVRGFLVKEAGDQEATLPFVLRSYYSLAGNILFNALVHANRKLLKYNKSRTVHDKGGASVLAGYMDGDLLALANVGSCGALLLRAGKCAELVIPRTYARLHDPFCEEPEHASAPLTALGIAEDLEPEITEYKLRAGDWLLLHSDGIGRGLPQELSELQKSGLAANMAIERVQGLLKARKYLDNSAVLLVIF